MVDNAQLDRALSSVLAQITERPVISVILGSGLGDFAEEFVERKSISTSAIPHYPVSTVQGHEGTLVFGRIRSDGRTSLPVLVFKGRVHYYETVDLDAVVFPIHLAAALGVRYLLVTNAAGGVGRSLAAGDLMLINDFVNFTFLYPQVNTQQRRGNPFAQQEYREFLDEELQAIFRLAATEMGVVLREGVYCWLKGPTYETKAEVEMFRRLGVDALGMSTVPEILAANELGIRVAGISLISNLAAGMSAEKLSHEEVTETGKRVRLTFSRLLKEVLLRIKP